MATTQYVGARYVPEFADPIEWDSQYSYEPLTIVTHEGNSYTSRQAVPKGIDIHNEAFWALTGNYNAQVEAYRQEVKQLAHSVQGYNTVEEMTSANLKVGTICVTSHFYTGDNGGASYIITSDGSADGVEKIALDNGYVATLLYSETMHIDQFGGSANYDDYTKILQAAFSCGASTLIFSNKTYYMHSVEIANNVTICGNGCVFFNNETVKSKITVGTDVSSAMLFYSTNAKRITMYDCTLDGNGQNVKMLATPTGLSYCCNIFFNAEVINAENCTFKNSYYTHMHLTYDGVASFNNCRFENNGIYAPEGASRNSFEIYRSNDSAMCSFICTNVQILNNNDSFARTDGINYVCFDNIYASGYATCELNECHNTSSNKQTYILRNAKLTNTIACLISVADALVENVYINITRRYEGKAQNCIAANNGILKAHNVEIKCAVKFNAFYSVDADIYGEDCVINADTLIYYGETKTSPVLMKNCAITCTYILHEYQTTQFSKLTFLGCTIFSQLGLENSHSLELQDCDCTVNSTYGYLMGGNVLIANTTITTNDGYGAPFACTGETCIVRNAYLPANTALDRTPMAPTKTLIAHDIYSNTNSVIDTLADLPDISIIHDVVMHSKYSGNVTLSHDNKNVVIR